MDNQDLSIMTAYVRGEDPANAQNTSIQYNGGRASTRVTRGNRATNQDNNDLTIDTKRTEETEAATLQAGRKVTRPSGQNQGKAQKKNQQSDDSDKERRSSNDRKKQVQRKINEASSTDNILRFLDQKQEGKTKPKKDSLDDWDEPNEPQASSKEQKSAKSQEQAKQIESDDKQLENSWMVETDDEPKTQPRRGNIKKQDDEQREHARGSRGNRNQEKEIQDERPTRGNRGNRHDNMENQDHRNDGFKKKPYNQSSYERGGNKTEDYKSFQERRQNAHNGQKRDRFPIEREKPAEYTGGGRGRNQYDRGYYNNDRGYNSGYRDRGGRGGRGGYRNREQDNRQFESYRGDRNNRSERGGDQDYTRGSQNYERSRRDGYEHTPRSYNNRSNREPDDQFVQNERKQRQRYEESQQQTSKIPETTVVVPAAEKKVEPPQKMSIYPRGLKCWPQSSIYIMETKFTFSYRQITENEADIIVVPYRNLNFDIYPGNIINKCTVNYREKIFNKGKAIEEPGFLYPQRCVGIQNFKIIGFLKLAKRVSENEVCVAKILDQISQLSITVETVLIPYSGELGPVLKFLDTLIKSIAKEHHLKEVVVSTNNGKEFKEGMSAFNTLVAGFVDANLISIDY